MKIPNITLVLLLIAVHGSVLCGEVFHKVEKGETLYSIAKQYEVSVDELIELNGINDPRDLRIGRTITIPGEDKIGIYKAKPGDTLYGIAKIHGITVGELLTMNELSRDYLLKVGDSLIVPKGSETQPELKIDEKETVFVKEIEQKSVKGPPQSVPIEFWPHEGPITFVDGKLNGMYFQGNLGDAVVSVAEGIVVWAGPYRGFGKVLIVQAENSFTYVYGGNGETFVNVGDRVRPGMEIGKLGILPNEGTPTLFFSVFKNGKAVSLKTSGTG